MMLRTREIATAPTIIVTLRAGFIWLMGAWCAGFVSALVLVSH